MKIDDIIQISQDMGDSDGFLALHSKLKKTPQIHAMAESHNLPIYVTKVNRSIYELVVVHLHIINLSFSGYSDKLSRSNFEGHSCTRNQKN